MPNDRTPPDPDTKLTPELLDYIEQTGESYLAPEVEALIEEQERWEDGTLLMAPVVERHEQELKMVAGHLAQQCRELRHNLEQIFPRNQGIASNNLGDQTPQQALAEPIRQIQQDVNLIRKLVDKYRAALNALGSFDYATTDYYYDGLSYCVKYLQKKATYDAIQQEFRTALRPQASLDRIYRYINYLPNLFSNLQNRLIEALWQKVPHQRELPDYLDQPTDYL
ncbi:hypothetical protein [Picosynechococcus sp. NKBG042902]|uniref:hypothetical protein n=1 Tax=Picosynechococcus sp. NKBG042902 TaxID=490193 RepID=UPI0004ABA217|nr:hypothetical protein [Picosynechococcus sp. NKBG042902]